MVKVIPYSTNYLEGVIDVLQYIWDDNENCRLKKFLWTYCQNPNSKEVLAVIAIDQNEEVVGFRGWVAGKIKVKDKFYNVVRAADAVVNPSSRRQGIFEKMTTYSIEYLKGKGIAAIINLSSNKYSNPGYKKLGWKDLSLFDIWYRINIFSSPKKEFVPSRMNYEDGIIEIFNQIPSTLVLPKQTTKQLSFILTEKELAWLLEKPNAYYTGAYSIDKNGILTSLFILNKATKNKYFMNYFYASNSKIASKVFNEITKRISYRFISVWAFALPEMKTNLLHKLKFHNLFYKKLKKKPPVLIKSLLTFENGKENWMIEGLDMRDIKNWEINLIDSF